VPTGQTPSRVQTEFPRRLIEGTPDDERVKKFRQLRSIVPATLDMEGIVEDDNDSVVSQLK
jgi:Kinesin-associated microtubule-binding